MSEDGFQEMMSRGTVGISQLSLHNSMMDMALPKSMKRAMLDDRVPQFHLVYVHGGHFHHAVTSNNLSCGCSRNTKNLGQLDRICMDKK